MIALFIFLVFVIYFIVTEGNIFLRDDWDDGDDDSW